jgi:uncharacterized protein (DUF362 family)
MVKTLTPMMNQVGIKRTNLDNLYQDVEALLDLIGYKPVRAKVLLKPNIVVAAPPEQGDTTHPKVIAALTQYFRKRNREVVVGEGTGIFATKTDFERLLQATGYARLRDEMGVEIINLEQEERERVPWKYGIIPLPLMLRDCEYVNVPTMKTHLQSTVSLGVKNQKGLIPMKTKKMFHKRGLHDCIYALSEVIQPSLTVMDALYCIEGTGPTGPPIGEVKRMDLLVAGKNMMAVDNVSAAIMGFDAAEIRHLRKVRDLRVLGEKIEDVRSPFKRPGDFFSRDHFVVHMDERACTMCTVSFYKALSKILYTKELREQLEKRKDLADIHLILGPNKPRGDLGSCVLCIGDCAAKTAKEAGMPLLKGCHPDYREIVNFLFPGAYPDVGKKDSGGTDLSKG